MAMVAFLGFLIYLGWRQKQKRIQRVKQAEADYRTILQRLKGEPNNPDLKEQALKLGRKYSGLTRQFHGNGGVTIYDEMAISNDINAACAAAPNAFQIKPGKAGDSIEERLHRLADLKAKGFIDEGEYELRRRRILDEV